MKENLPPYDPAKIEKKWQKAWADSKLYASKESASKDKYYVLDMFPYPSGEGLHVGHPKGYIATDVVSRMKRMQGMNVLHPMGFDAFGLPAENYAIKTKTNPADSVAKNVERFKKQLEIIGLDYDWSREVNTTDPGYYRWTQWIFLQLYKKGLAYESNEPINWCPSCKTGLANEDVEDGRCERCGTPVEKKPLRQWVLRITDYADRLLRDLDAKTGIPMVTKDHGPDAFRPEEPVSERWPVVVIIKHWSEDRYLCANWKATDWKGFVIGGIEDGETALQAAARETLEETGYKNVKSSREVGKVDARFYQVVKKHNRVAHFTGVFLELANGERGEVSQDEKDLQDLVWLTKGEVGSFLNHPDMVYLWELYTGAQKQEITPLLDWPEPIKESQRNWIGRSEGAEIDFRLTITNEKRKPRFVLIHGYKGAPDDDFFPWLKKEFEALGHEVQTPALPNPDDPNEAEQVEYVLKNCTLDENTVVIGHSLGAVVALKAIMKANKPISGLVLVAAARDPVSVKAKDRSPFHKSFTWDYDYERIARLASGKIAVISDTKEADTTEYHKHLAHRLSAGFINVAATEEHFTGKHEPAILDCCTPKVKVFTTRPDTIFGVTYVVLAPEHMWVGEFMDRLENRAEVEAYISRAASETEIERTDATKEKTGVELKGIKAVNPATGEEVPVWIADYVLADYGTGAVMAVPAHDERDFAFAKKFKLPVKQVVAPEFGERLPNEEFRDGVCMVIFDPKTQRYAVTKDDKGHVRICSGGNDEGESYKDAALREAKEESGLHDFRAVEEIGEYYTHYTHSLKNLNRHAHSMCYVGVLASAATVPQKLDGHEKFELAWVAPHELLETWEKTWGLAHVSHWEWLLRQSVGWLIEHGYDTTSDKKRFATTAYVGDGKLVHSGPFSDKRSESVMKDITAFAGGRWVTKYKLRDWVFSRQRYWGEPIPLIHCDECGVVPVPEKDLPVVLPKVESYEPTGTGESPLAAIEDWVNVACPQCGGKGKRETNTMPQWAGSCWYYLRYEDPKNDAKLVDPKKEKYWSPVDLYVGGAEHATRHLIYARFWHKFLFDIGVVSHPEPFTKLQSVGLIMGEDGRKMSKRFGNVVNPDDIVATYGADTLRVYEMFMGPFDQQIAWNTSSMVGARRFIERVWKMRDKLQVSSDKKKGNASLSQIMHKTIKKVSEDIVGLRFNTAISALMIASNELEKQSAVSKADYEALVKLLAPFAPHAAEELWSALGNTGSIHVSAWPEYDAMMTVDSEATIIVQVDGKVRASFTASAATTGEDLKKQAMELPAVKRWLEGKTVKKAIAIPGRLVNIVT